MKNCFYFLSLFILFGFFSFSQSGSLSIKLTNNSKYNFTNEVAAIPWKMIKNTNLKNGKIMVTEKATGNKIINQIVDNDGDGLSDELLIKVSLKSGESKNYILSTQTEPSSDTTMVGLKFVKGREDVAWENDRIAFRMYGPALAKDVNNGIDVWTKRVRYPIVEKWYGMGDNIPGGKDPYHIDRGEGADFFSVGRSLGAGSSCLYKNDSLYQPGVFSSYKFLANGPIRVVFELNYKPVVYNGDEISEKKRITFDVGSNLNKIEVFYESKNKNKNVEFAVGLIKRKNIKTYSDKNIARISSWGSTNDDPVNGSLGLGALIDKKSLKNIKEDDTHILFIGKTNITQPITYYSGAGWSRSGDFNSAEDWNKYLVEFAGKLKSKLKIDIK